MTTTLVIAIIVPTAIFLLSVLIYRTKNLDMITFIDPKRVPEDKKDQLLRYFLVLMSIVCILMFLMIISTAFNYTLTIIFVLAMCFKLIAFYGIYKYLIKN
ncbi:hypothetical protein [Staphylococcus massiliensis]|uniref:DUF3784 domain-containing protein n=1 Tax=Staphylococcus massiliensis S46 TaxID=1229783 RepID=K9AST8_9STAP|nr:hypothetical protein [Staphylococcus massiliensis]EKU50359.1 hypothetical protein C273_00010 [Staphylococcus massiliensis S46]MCG3401433.1 hypothetical protein [Staphylococcus massiliensis]PNZ98136.1 hypothetical protein CD133_09290 [Staphylococcus massiliensis CCUG 55927]